MRLRQIEVFHAIYVTGSISAAARSLGVSQPSVSKVIHHAEDQIGFKLFELVRGRVVPTDEAHALFREVDEVFGRLRSLQRAVRNIRTLGGGHLRVGVLPSLALALAPAAIARFRDKHPNVTFDVQTLHHDELFQALYERECDFAIAYDPPIHQRMKRQTLGSGELVLLHRHGDLDDVDADAPLTLHSLSGRELIGLTASGPLGQLLSTEMERQGISVREIISTQTFYIASALVRHGAGVTVVDEFTARAGASDTIIYRGFTPPLRFDVAVVFLEDRPMSALASAFVKLFGAILESRRAINL